MSSFLKAQLRGVALDVISGKKSVITGPSIQFCPNFPTSFSVFQLPPRLKIFSLGSCRGCLLAYSLILSLAFPFFLFLSLFFPPPALGVTVKIICWNDWQVRGFNEMSSS